MIYQKKNLPLIAYTNSEGKIYFYSLACFSEKVRKFEIWGVTGQGRRPCPQVGKDSEGRGCAPALRPDREREGRGRALAFRSESLGDGRRAHPLAD